MSNAVDKQISSILSLIKEQAKNAEDTYDKKADRLLNQAERGRRKANRKRTTRKGSCRKKELKDTNNTISILEQKMQAVENEIREGIDPMKSEQINAELERVKMTISTDYKNLEEKATLAK